MAYQNLAKELNREELPVTGLGVIESGCSIDSQLLHFSASDM